MTGKRPEIAPIISSLGLLTNSSWNLLGFTFSVLANLAIIPFVVNVIGLPSFGMAGLVIAISSPLMIIGTVIGQAIITRVAPLLGKRDIEGANRMAGIAFAYCFVTGMIGAAIITAVGPPAALRFVSGSQSDINFFLAFLISLAGLLARQLVMVLQSFSAAGLDYKRLARNMAWSAVADVTAISSCVTWLPTTIGYLSGIALGSIITLIVWIYTFRALPFRPSTQDLIHEGAALREFAKWHGLSSLMGILSQNIDRLMLGIVGSPTHVGSYNIANRFQEAAYICLIKGSEVLLPYFSTMREIAPEKRHKNFLISTWIVNLFGIIALAPMVPLSHSILLLWVGPAAATAGTFLLQILMVGGMIGLGGTTFNYYALGMGDHRLVARISIVFALTTLLLTVALVAIFGPAAAGIAMVVASLVRLVILFRSCHSLYFPEMSIGDMAIISFLPIVSGLIMGLGVENFSPLRPSSWFEVLKLYGLFALAICLSIVVTALTTRIGRTINFQLCARLRDGSRTSRARQHARWSQ